MFTMIFKEFGHMDLLEMRRSYIQELYEYALYIKNPEAFFDDIKKMKRKDILKNPQNYSTAEIMSAMKTKTKKKK